MVASEEPLFELKLRYEGSLNSNAKSNALPLGSPTQKAGWVRTDNIFQENGGRPKCQWWETWATSGTKTWSSRKGSSSGSKPEKENMAGRQFGLKNHKWLWTPNSLLLLFAFLSNDAGEYFDPLSLCSQVISGQQGEVSRMFVFCDSASRTKRAIYQR